MRKLNRPLLIPIIGTGLLLQLLDGNGKEAMRLKQEKEVGLGLTEHRPTPTSATPSPLGLTLTLRRRKAANDDFSLTEKLKKRKDDG